MCIIFKSVRLTSFWCLHYSNIQIKKLCVGISKVLVKTQKRLFAHGQTHRKPNNDPSFSFDMAFLMALLDIHVRISWFLLMALSMLYVRASSSSASSTNSHIMWAKLFSYTIIGGSECFGINSNSRSVCVCVCV